MEVGIKALNVEVAAVGMPLQSGYRKVCDAEGSPTTKAIDRLCEFLQVEHKPQFGSPHKLGEIL